MACSDKVRVIDVFRDCFWSEDLIPSCYIIIYCCCVGIHEPLVSLCHASRVYQGTATAPPLTPFLNTSCHGAPLIPVVDHRQPASIFVSTPIALSSISINFCVGISSPEYHRVDRTFSRKRQTRNASSLCGSWSQMLQHAPAAGDLASSHDDVTSSSFTQVLCKVAFPVRDNICICYACVLAPVLMPVHAACR